MKIKLLAFFLSLLMVTSIGCGNTILTETDPDTNAETVPEKDADIEAAKKDTESETNANTEALETEAPPTVPPLSDYGDGSSVGTVNVATKSGAITGAKDITIPRPDQSGRTLSADRYLSPEKTGAQNASGFSNMLAAITASYSDSVPITMIDIPKGTYRIKSSRQYAIHFKALTNLVIEGNGSLFIFEDSDKTINSAAFFTVENCDTVEFRNFAVDFDWDTHLLSVIATVISSDVTTKSVVFRVDSHKLPQVINIDSGRPWDPALDNRSETVGFIPSGSIKKTEALDDNTLRITYSSDKSAQNAKAGQQIQFHFKPNFNAAAFRMYSSKNVTLNNITIYSAPQAAADCYTSDGYHLIDCKVIPADGRRFTTFTGFETHAVKGNVIIEGCELSGILDDNIHISNHFMGGENVKIDAYTVEMRHLQTFTFKHFFFEGAELGLYDENHQPLGWRSVIESVTSTNEGVNSMATYTVKFRDPVPDTLPSNCKFIIENYYNGSFIIRNNTFRGGLCHALYIGLGNGTIENNTFDNFAYPSLVLTTVTRWERWHIGVGVENVVIRGNTMTRCNTAQRDPASLAIAAGRDEKPSDFYPLDDYVIRNVLVENNVVDGSTGSAFAIFSAEDIIVRNNQFLNSNTLPTSKPRRIGLGNAYISNANNITWENNIIKNDGKAYENGLYVDKQTVYNFTSR